MCGLLVGRKIVDCAPWWHSEYMGSATLCSLCLASQFVDVVGVCTVPVHAGIAVVDVG